VLPPEKGEHHAIIHDARVIKSDHACPKCGTTMVLTRIVPHAPGQHLRTFECPTCEHVETEVVKFE
jgi:predicted RNA-binding Zn-ribbon protein involved in translation (DUF1610 family)